MAERSETVSVHLRVSYDRAFDYVTNDLFWQDWALAILRRTHIAGDLAWIDPQESSQRPLTRSPGGVAVEIAPAHREGTVVWTFIGPDSDGHLPTRIVRRPDGDGVDYVWTLDAGPDQSDVSFAQSQTIVKEALDVLKTKIERQG